VELNQTPAHCDLPCRFDRACESLGDDYACNQGVCRPESEVVREEKEREMDASVPQFVEPASLFDSSPVILVDSGLPDSLALAPDTGWPDTGVVCPQEDAGLEMPVVWQPPAWEPFVSDAGRDELFKIVKETFVGRWHGLATSPFPYPKPYLVDLEFKADGHYGGRCSEVMQPCCRAFYDGTDRESELKQYRLLDAQASGYVIGDIDIVYPSGDGFVPAGHQGRLSYIERDRSGNGLRLRYGTDARNVVQFDLRRVTTP
jgi:hypothetical protein